MMSGRNDLLIIQDDELEKLILEQQCLQNANEVTRDSCWNSSPSESTFDTDEEDFDITTFEESDVEFSNEYEYGTLVTVHSSSNNISEILSEKRAREYGLSKASLVEEFNALSLQNTTGAQEEFNKYQGLRLSNYQSDCYINTAVNSIISNFILMSEIEGKSSQLLPWMKNALNLHSPESTILKDASTDSIHSEWQIFLSSPIYCITEHGGLECYASIKEEYDQRVKEQSIMDEILDLFSRKKSQNNLEGIANVRSLKSRLGEYYTYMDCYTRESQEDANTPFFHIIESIPNLLQKFKISGKTKITCIQCRKETVNNDDSNSYIFLSSDYDATQKRDSIQTKIKEWCNSVSTLEKRCKCSIFANSDAVEEMYKTGHIAEDETLMKNTVHESKFEVIEPPEVLYVRTASDANARTVVTVDETIEVNDQNYELKSAMLYTGNGSFGHWRMLSKEGKRFLLYDDARKPKILEKYEEQQYLDKCTDFVYIAVDGSTPAHETEKVDMKMHQEDSSSKKENNIEIAASLMEAYAHLMDRNGNADVHIYV